ncbi:MAG TPA: metallopeptidase family protein [Limnochorda sp.]
MTFKAFADAADRLASQIPEPLLEGLTGGIQVSREERQYPDDPPDVRILGEYITDPYLGAYIVLYHGSFRRLFAGEPEEVWLEELAATLRHELRHHLEARAGLSDLDLEDMKELQRLWEEWIAMTEGEEGGEGAEPGESREPRAEDGDGPGGDGGQGDAAGPSRSSDQGSRRWWRPFWKRG